MCLNPEKTKLFAREVKVLRHLRSQLRFRPKKTALQKFAEMEFLAIVEELRKFLYGVPFYNIYVLGRA